MGLASQGIPDEWDSVLAELAEVHKDVERLEVIVKAQTIDAIEANRDLRYLLAKAERERDEARELAKAFREECNVLRAKAEVGGRE